LCELAKARQELVMRPSFVRVERVKEREMTKETQNGEEVLVRVEQKME
jgi:hypothetical protein